ncbi:MAG: hypothetical protein RL213_1844 [Bacteroidota bacterium]
MPFLSVAARTASVRETVSGQLEWKGVHETKLPDERVFLNQYFEGAVLDGNFLPCYEQLFELPAGSYDAKPQLTVVRTEKISDTRGIAATDLSADFKVNCRTVYRKKKPFAAVNVCAIRASASGGYERLVEFRLSAQPLAGTAPARARRTAAASSALSAGEWYRVAVTGTGVYRLSYAFLKNIGMDVDRIDPRNLRVYGSGGGQLPYLNSATPYEEAPENAIYVYGESDGRFDQGDYALFYGTSQTVWKYDSSNVRFSYKTNQYCDTTYYFITADAGVGKRISSRSTSASQPVVNVTTFNDYAFHENDQYNLLKSGREWYGERMDNINPTRSFSFTFPNVTPGSPIILRAGFLGRAINSINNNNNAFIVKVNGTTIATQYFADVGTSPQDNYALPVSLLDTVPASGANVDVTIQFYSSDPGAIGWVNFIELNGRCSLTANGRPAQFRFRDAESVGPGNTAQFNIPGIGANHLVWDVTDPVEVVLQETADNNGIRGFAASAEDLHEYIAFTPSSAGDPIAAGKMKNQDLHGLSEAEMIIVTYPGFRAQSEQLAAFHRSRGLTVHVADTREVYNEFSSGAQDVCAIRNFVKMFYERATTPEEMPRYLLLMGDASYDNKYRITDNTNFVPSYQSTGSLNQTQTYTSDDFFGLLDQNEGEWGNGEIVDMAVGRLPVKSVAEAQSAVDKIIDYGGSVASAAESASTRGDWRNIVAFVADDQDNNTHLKQADALADTVDSRHRLYNIDKIYMDAFNQITTPGGQRYPEAQRAIVDRIERGALLLTYIGHGGEVGWAHERVLEVSDINGWTNKHRLAAFLTATCEFTRVDDPSRTSAGEYVFLNPQGGGICLFTTSRLAFSSSNYNLAKKFYTHVFEPFEGRVPTLGEVFEETKADVFSDIYVRNFLLIGDPALPLAYPTFNVRTTEINGRPVQVGSDTLKALRRVTVSGEVTDLNGNRLTGFNGIITPTVYDKKMTYYTLGNDQNVSSDPSIPRPFTAQRNVIFKGKTSVTNGSFTFTFVVPKDIQFPYGFGKISYYAQNGVSDATGYDTSIVVGGFDAGMSGDEAGPAIRLYMNDEKFIRGSMTDENPKMLAFISDSSGINGVGSGIGHDMTAVLDNDAGKTFVVNDYFQYDLDSYRQGKVTFPFEDLSTGPHSLKFKVWDVHNNSSEAITDFIVEESAVLALDHVMNYPNPFTTSTTFMFEHNRPYTPLDAQIQVFTVSGKLLKTISGRILNEGFRSEELKWDGLDDFGDRIGKGVYIYKLKVRTPDGSTADKFEKLVILR